jgi:nucleoside-diphosphate-sugar epimerase
VEFKCYFSCLCWQAMYPRLVVGSQSLSFSNKLIWNVVSGKGLTEPDFPFWVDVRDVAVAHVKVLRKAETVRWERILLAYEAALYSDMADIARREFKGELKPSEERQSVEYYEIDASGSEVRGIEEFIGVERMVRDTVGQVSEAGRNSRD